MVEATNYVYLAILICLQYLGLQHESYQITIHLSKVNEIQQPKIEADLTKIEDKVNEWLISSPKENHKVSMTIVKDSITDIERGRSHITKFSEVNFNRLTKQKDTIFSNNNNPLMVISEGENAIVFKVLDNSVYNLIAMKANQ